VDDGGGEGKLRRTRFNDGEKREEEREMVAVEDWDNR
jgi:hypothetical protein